MNAKTLATGQSMESAGGPGCQSNSGKTPVTPAPLFLTQFRIHGQRMEQKMIVDCRTCVQLSARHVCVDRFNSYVVFMYMNNRYHTSHSGYHTLALYPSASGCPIMIQHSASNAQECCDPI